MPVYPSVCLSVRLSVSSHGTIRPSLDGFLWKLIFECFWKFCEEKIKFLLRSDKNKVYFT